MTSKPNIILDLDQTLISAEPYDKYDFKKNSNKAKMFDFTDMNGYYIVFHRPHLQGFLDFVFENFNVSIWTAATKSYALYIINNIILKDHKERKIDWVFFSYHCGISEKKKGGTKNLKSLWSVFKLKNYNEKNTIIIDDYEAVYETQKDNCVFAKPFKFMEKDSYKDEFLLELEPLLDEMKKKIEKGERKPAKGVNKALGKLK